MIEILVKEDDYVEDCSTFKDLSIDERVKFLLNRGTSRQEKGFNYKDLTIEDKVNMLLSKDKTVKKEEKEPLMLYNTDNKEVVIEKKDGKYDIRGHLIRSKCGKHYIYCGYGHEIEYWNNKVIERELDTRMYKYVDSIEYTDNGGFLISYNITDKELEELDKEGIQEETAKPIKDMTLKDYLIYCKIVMLQESFK